MEKTEKNYLIFHASNEEPVRTTIVGIYDSGVLRLSASRCSEKDHFIKKVGRELAIERLEKGEFITEFKVKNFDKQNFYEIAELVSGGVIKFGLKQKFEVIDTFDLYYSNKDDYFQQEFEEIAFSELNKNYVLRLVKND